MLTEHILVVPESTWTLENYIFVEFRCQIHVVVVFEDERPGTTEVTVMVLESLKDRRQEVRNKNFRVTDEKSLREIIAFRKSEILTEDGFL
jgi:hypothetical protein